MNINEDEIMELLFIYWQENFEKSSDFKEVSSYLESLENRLSKKQLLTLEEVIVGYAAKSEKKAFYGAFQLIKDFSKFI